MNKPVEFKPPLPGWEPEGYIADDTGVHKRTISRIPGEKLDWAGVKWRRACRHQRKNSRSNN